MLSAKQRMKLIDICVEIVNGRTVTLDDMIWAEKLAKYNNHAYKMLKESRDNIKPL